MQYQTSMTRGQPDNEAIRFLREYEPLALRRDPRGYCVCTSEGKDSRVLGHLMRRAGVKHFYMHSITGIDPPELIYFQRRNFQAYRDMGYITMEIMYEQSLWELCRKKQMLPMRTRRFCCEALKERPVPQTGQAFLSMGVRKFESVGRMKRRDEVEIATTKKDSMIFPYDNDEKRRDIELCYRDKQTRINPIARWTTEDIWAYTQDAKLAQCSLYAEGFHRLGCIGCPMAGHAGREMEFARWPKFRDQYIRTAQRIIDNKPNGHPFKKRLQSGREYFDWWMQDRAQEEANGNQLSFWEAE